MRTPLATLVAAALVTTACGKAASATPTSPSAAPAGPIAAAAPAAPREANPPATAGRKLLFFMNPDGQPCQLQDRILHGMTDLTAQAEVVYLRTSEPSHLQAFQGFGIRALPTLVLVDAGGRELRRSTPGVQTADAVRALLAP